MRIGCDIDEVVARSVGTVLDLLGKTYGLKWVYSDIYCYNFEKICFVKNEEFNMKIVSDILSFINDPNVHSMFEPYEDAVKYLKKYKNEGHSLHFVSARPTEESNTIEWFKKWGIPFDSIQHILGGKGQIVNSLNLDVFIEDCPGCLEKIIEKNSQIRLFLLDKPWNRDYIHSRVIKVRSWVEFNAYLMGV